METRKITIIGEAFNGTKVINSAAETLGELKRDLQAAGINTVDQDFYEGLSRTKLVDDNSQLPKDVNYNGRVTNELVFSLTTTNKKIKSGVDRSVLFSEIKKKGLAELIKTRYGRNYTQVSSMDLERVLSEYSDVKSTPNNMPTNDSSNEGLTAEEALKAIQDILNKVHKKVEEKTTSKVEDSLKSPYTDEELKLLGLK